MGGKIQLGGTAFTPAPPVTPGLYAARGGADTTSNLYTVNTSTGATTSIGPIGFAVTGLAFRPSDNVLFGATSNQSGSNPASLITIDPGTGAGTLVGAFNITTPVASAIADLSFRSDSVLFGEGAATHRLYTINQGTGAATQVSATTIAAPYSGGGTAFNSADVLYVFPKRDNGIYYIVNSATGALTAQPVLTGSPEAGGQVAAAAFDVADLCWVVSIGATNTWIDTINVGTSTVTGIGHTDRTLDALAWAF